MCRRHEWLRPTKTWRNKCWGSRKYRKQHTFCSFRFIFFLRLVVLSQRREHPGSESSQGVWTCVSHCDCGLFEASQPPKTWNKLFYHFVLGLGFPIYCHVSDSRKAVPIELLCRWQSSGSILRWACCHPEREAWIKTGWLDLGFKAGLVANLVDQNGG